MRRPSPAWLPATAWTVVLLQIVFVVAPALTPTLAFAQGTEPSSVDRGREYYEQSRFDEAVALLQDLVDRGALSGPDLQKARELLARSLVKKGYPVRARNLFKAILKQDAAWRPDPIRVPPDEAAVFEQALKEFEAEQGAATPPPTPPVTPPAETKPVPVTPPPPTPATTPAPARPVPASTIVPQEKKSSKTLWWIVGGVAAAAIIGVAAAGGGGGGGDDGTPATPLPDFPPPPTP